MKLNPAQLARLEIFIARSAQILRQLSQNGANQFGHGQHDGLMLELKRQGDEIRKIGRSIGHTRNALQVSRYKREAWGDRSRRQSHGHGVDRVEIKLNKLLTQIEDIFATTKQRDDPNGGLFDLSTEISKGVQEYSQVISVDVRNDANTLTFQNADMAVDPIQGVIMLVGLGLEMWRLYSERKKKDREFATRNPDWK